MLRLSTVNLWVKLYNNFNETDQLVAGPMDVQRSFMLEARAAALDDSLE